MKNGLINSNIIIKCSDYEEHITSIFFRASEGTFSGGIVFYLENNNIINWYTQLINYDGKKDSVVLLELGKPDGKWAYYVNIRVHAKDLVGHSTISINLIDYQSADVIRSCKFDINCDPQQIIQLGKCIKKSYSEKSLVEWGDKNN